MSATPATVLEIRSGSVAKLKDGFSPIAHSLLGAWLQAGLTSRQYRTLLAVARYAYGYQSNRARVSLKTLAKFSGLTVPHLSEAMTALISTNLLIRNSGQRGEIEINNHVETWRLPVNPPRQFPQNGETEFPQNGETEFPQNGETGRETLLIDKNKKMERMGKESKTPSPHSKSGTNGTPYQTILDAYHAELPMLRRVCKLTPARKQALDSAWNDSLLGSNPSRWMEFFHYVATQCPFLIGQKPGKDGTFFQSDLEWLMQEDHLVRIVEGKYEGDSICG